MWIILEPLKQAGMTGVEMQSSNGDICQVFPILTCYVADYPEQCLVMCTKYGTCPKCQASAKELGESIPKEACTRNWTESIIKEEKEASQGSAPAFHKQCMSYDVSGSVYTPFWQGFPLCNIHKCITPDILHRLYQGVFKHLIEWCQCIMTPAALDQRIQAIPLGFGLRHFKNGFSALSQVSGPECKNMAKILLGCLVVQIAPIGIHAIKALLDFIYLAQYPTHNTQTLEYLKDALDDFNKNKQYFIQVQVWDNLNIPKFHALLHYIKSIENFGTTDNYNTEMFERLHIDFAKEGWCASNQRDEFLQMIRWLSRQEKVKYFDNHIGRLLASSSLGEDEIITEGPPNPHHPSISIAKYPNFRNCSISAIENLHNAPQLSRHLKIFLNSFLPTPVSNRNLDSTSLPISHIDVYNMFRFQHGEIHDNDEEKDIVKAIPRSKKLSKERFNTVVVIDTDEAEATGLAGVLSSSSITSNN